MIKQGKSDKEILASNLAFYRKHAKLTQLELAEKFNYSDKAISKWERGESAPDVFVLKSLAEFYDISLTDFFKEKPKEPRHRKNNVKHLIITFLSMALVWLVATIIFVLLGMSQVPHGWLVFIAAIPATCILGIIFSSLWGNKVLTLIAVSLTCWSVTLILYLPLEILTDFTHMWLLWMIPIPLQVMAILWYLLKCSYLFKKKKDNKEEIEEANKN